MTEREYTAVFEATDQVRKLLAEIESLRNLVQLLDQDEACVSIDRIGWSGSNRTIDNPRIKTAALVTVRGLIEAAISDATKELELLPMPNPEGRA